MIKRTIFDLIIKNQKPGFINIIYGPRRVGKTVLLNQIKDYYKTETAIFFNGDNNETVEALSKNSDLKLTELIKNYLVIFIDEAQRIPNIGLSLKIIIDKFPNKKIFVTGSSSLDLVKGVQESLTGRNLTYRLFPFSFLERASGVEEYKMDSLLDELLIFGSYPDVKELSEVTAKQTYLENIIEDYLFKDVMFLERIDRPDIFKKLTILLAWQIGQPVSLSELSKNLLTDVKTVSRYLSLLEKSFVIFSVNSYSKNLRKELAKSKKYYFYDLGIRNALINQFFPLGSRVDVGSLWENFIFVERCKKNEYAGRFCEYFFWRNYQAAEVDLIEADGFSLKSWEIKWGSKKYKTPKSFYDLYNLEADLVNRENYKKFIV